MTRGMRRYAGFALQVMRTDKFTGIHESRRGESRDEHSGGTAATDRRARFGLVGTATACGLHRYFHQLPGRPVTAAGLQQPIPRTDPVACRFRPHEPSPKRALRSVGTAESDGTVFRIVRYAPGVAPRHHRTNSINYAVVMSGSMEMELDDQTVRLNAGDVLVQRGTIHNWVNNGTGRCVIAFVLIGARPATCPNTPGKLAHNSPSHRTGKIIEADTPRSNTMAERNGMLPGG
jgi:quercetin dioxygenase-like cupin family protein